MLKMSLLLGGGHIQFLHGNIPRRNEPQNPPNIPWSNDILVVYNEYVPFHGDIFSMIPKN